jgi:polyhydroxybutyrate depolymerase
MGFHGTDDWVVSYEPTSYYPGFRETLAGWAERNGCGTATRITYERGDSICETFDDCPEGVDVTRCTIEGGGHQWPGGRAAPGLGHMTRDLSATDAMWDFMVAHPRRP